MAKNKRIKRRACVVGSVGKQAMQEKMYVLMMDRKIKAAIPDTVKRKEYIRALINDMDKQLLATD